jgi:hypothetical protein
VKCGNWYTPLPKEPDDACIHCIEGKHAVHPKTGVVDCHFMEMTTTPSERSLQELSLELTEARRTVEALPEGIQATRTQAGVTSAMMQAEHLLARVEQRMQDVPRMLTWAGVKEMPGLRDGAPSQRFKNIDGISELVKQYRRAPSDMEEMTRSMKVCNEIASEFPGLMAEIRIGVNQVRRAVDHWVAPAITAAPEKARAATAKRRGARAKAAA